MGHIIGAFHHVSVNGVAWAFHQRIQMLRTGSPGSWGMRVVSDAAAGHVQKTASALNPRRIQNGSWLKVLGLSKIFEYVF
jgi:hypothetical protein